MEEERLLCRFLRREIDDIASCWNPTLRLKTKTRLLFTMTNWFGSTTFASKKDIKRDWRQIRSSLLFIAERSMSSMTSLVGHFLSWTLTLVSLSVSASIRFNSERIGRSIEAKKKCSSRLFLPWMDWKRQFANRMSNVFFHWIERTISIVVLTIRILPMESTHWTTGHFSDYRLEGRRESIGHSSFVSRCRVSRSRGQLSPEDEERDQTNCRRHTSSHGFQWATTTDLKNRRRRATSRLIQSDDLIALSSRPLRGDHQDSFLDHCFNCWLDILDNLLIEPHVCLCVHSISLQMTEAFQKNVDWSVAINDVSKEWKTFFDVLCRRRSIGNRIDNDVTKLEKGSEHCRRHFDW